MSVFIIRYKKIRQFMSQLIDFSQFQYKKTVLPKQLNSSIPESFPQGIEISEDEYNLTVTILVHNNPNKISFTIDEVATFMNVSNEFIRRRIKAGKIKAVYYGDKPTIHITELARVLTKGIQ